MARFKLLGGVHTSSTDEEATTHEFSTKKDVIVESDNDLDKMFANQFERLDGKTKRPRDRDDSLDNSGRVMDEPEHIRRRKDKKKRQRIAQDEEDNQMIDQPRGLGAKKTDGTRVRGEDPDDDEFPDPDDDEEIGSSESGDDNPKSKKSKSKKAADKSKDEDEGDTSADEGDKGEVDAEKSEFGEDVTTYFPEAESVDLKVFKQVKSGKARFTVVDSDEPTKALHPKTFGDKKAVNKFVKSQMVQE